MKMKNAGGEENDGERLVWGVSEVIFIIIINNAGEENDGERLGWGVI